METKKIIGLVIIILNVSGLGFLFYMGGLRLMDRLFPKEAPETQGDAEKVKRPAPKVDREELPEDDLLKDMDLSDLDNLDLDEFE